MMQTAETRTVEVVSTEINSTSSHGLIAGAGIVIAASSIALLTGGMTIDFPSGPQGLIPTLGILIGMAFLCYFIMKSNLVIVTRAMQEVKVHAQPKSSSTPEVSPGTKSGNAASEQTAAGGDETKPVAAQPSAPKRDRNRDRAGGKGRDDGSSKAPHDETSGDGKPVQKRVPEDA